MAPISRKRSLSNMQDVDVTSTCITSSPSEYNDTDFVREVLQYKEGQTEAVLDDLLTQEAEKLGIALSKLQSPGQDVHNSMCESDITVASQHVRSASSESQDSMLTAITTTSSTESSVMVQSMKKKPSVRRSLSFSEYEKYLAQAGAQQPSKFGFVPTAIPAEPTPSLFSVSSRRSYMSIRSGFKNRFRLRRGKSTDDMK